MLFPARPRSTVTRMSVPMAVPVERGASVPIGTRFAASAQEFLARTRTQAVRRIVLWLLITLCIGILALAYLLQTSRVASLANDRATLENEISTMQDTNARLAAQAAGFQTLSRADSTAGNQGLRTPLAANVVYATLPDVIDPPPVATPAPARPPGIIGRIKNALVGRAGADKRAPSVVVTPGVKP
jgi:preprotein translocase subunit SecG